MKDLIKKYLTEIGLITATGATVLAPVYAMEHSDKLSSLDQIVYDTTEITGERLDVDFTEMSCGNNAFDTKCSDSDQEYKRYVRLTPSNTVLDVSQVFNSEQFDELSAKVDLIWKETGEMPEVRATTETYLLQAVREYIQETPEEQDAHYASKLEIVN